MRVAACLAVLLSLFSTLATAAQSVESVRLWRAPDHTRLVFDLSGPIDHKLMSLSAPERLVIDIDDVQLKAKFDALELDNTTIRKVRSAVRNQRDLRVVLDLKGDVKPRSFVLKPNQLYGHRLVIDLYDKQEQAAVAPTQAPQADQKRDIVIAIDAGHGGEDPGALGPSRILEKNVVLAIAKKLATEINGRQGYKAVLVRTGDYYVKHKRRWELAREARADLFLSIHADAFTDPRAKGGSVYALSRKGTTSAMARFLENSENTDLAGEVNIAEKEEMVAKTLTDLVMTNSLVSSLDVGNHVLRGMDGVLHLHSKRVEQANFRVLKAPDVPSILVETGFISNPQEERDLNSSRHQQRVAQAIFGGVRRYFEGNPPEGSYIAWLKDQGAPRRHRIKSGDTLSTIARHYSVSVTDLRRANDLRSNVIRVGQILTIPAS